MKTFFENKKVILSLRISGWISLVTALVITFRAPRIFAEHKVLGLILCIMASLSDYKKDYKSIPTAKRVIMICGWLLFYCICLFAAFYLG